MKSKPILSTFVAILLALSLATSLVGCMGQDDGTEGMVTASSQFPTTMPEVSTPDVVVDGVLTDELSTFESKDPFIQQVTDTGGGETPPTDTTYGPTTTVYTTTTYYTTTTRYQNTTTTWWTTTTKKPTTTTTKPTSTTTTTAAHVHSLKILSIDKIDDAPAVTLRVDSSVYKNRRIGDVVSTTWGQVRVVDISLSSKVVTLLHGSETVTLEAGQQIYE